jgi:hypothetical protein
MATPILRVLNDMVLLSDTGDLVVADRWTVTAVHDYG